MNVLQEKLKQQKRVREKAAKNRTPPSQRKEQYNIPVETDAGSSEAKMDSPTDSESSGDGASHQKLDQLPLASAKSNKLHSSSTNYCDTIPKRKPVKKPIESPKYSSKPPRSLNQPLPSLKEKIAKYRKQQPIPAPKPPPLNTVSADSGGKALPRPPTLDESSQPQSDSGQFKPPSPSTSLTIPLHDNTSVSQAPQSTGIALLEEMMAELGRPNTRTANKTVLAPKETCHFW